MNQVPRNLLDFKSNVHSQNGEDGVIQEILQRLEIKDPGTFCELGAWDGIHLSNTYNLVKRGWKGVYIEGDEKKFYDLLETGKKHSPNITAINRFVETTGKNTLDNILKDTFLPKDFDILSIDIDSFDYQIWDSFKNYQPKIVIIEINSGVNPNTEQIHTVDSNTGRVILQGSSYISTLKLGEQKGYFHVCHTGNMIFVRNDLNNNLFSPGKFSW